MRQSQYLLFSAICISAGCDSYISTTGYVLDESGDPIEDAIVTLTPTDEPGGKPFHKSRTTPQGFFLVGEVYSANPTRSEDEFLLRITKHGYKPHEEVIQSGIHADETKLDKQVILKTVPSLSANGAANNAGVTANAGSE